MVHSTPNFMANIQKSGPSGRVVRRCVWLRNLAAEEAIACAGLQSQRIQYNNNTQVVMENSIYTVLQITA
jgi:hypothetical protein